MLVAPVTTDLDVLKQMGHAHLLANRLEPAMMVFAGVLRQSPDDIEALLALGDFYLAAGDGATAAHYYTRAQARNASTPALAVRLHLAQLEGLRTGGAGAPAALAPEGPQALQTLAQRLTGRPCALPEHTLGQAAQVLAEIAASAHPAGLIAERLCEIEALIPALLELNVRQAQADGFGDLATALQALRTAAGAPEPATEAASEPATTTPGPAPLARANILFVAADGRLSARQAFARQAVMAAGGDAVVVDASSLEPDQAQAYDAIVTGPPAPGAPWTKRLAACALAGVRIVVDLGGTAARADAATPPDDRSLAAILQLADVVCVSTEMAAQPLRAAGHRVAVLPDGWVGAMPEPSAPAVARPEIVLGWLGIPTGEQPEADTVAATAIRAAVSAAVRAHPDARLAVGGAPAQYRAFADLPEAQRGFVPVSTRADLGDFLRQVDILLLPYPKTDSAPDGDGELLQAGAGGVPWVASPCEAYRGWLAGGAFAEAPADWQRTLNRLLADPPMRQKLAAAGRRQAATREVGRLGAIWLAGIVGSDQPAK